MGQREPWLPGADVERLLQYHRPMLEDGSIEYSFYFREGSTNIHPALDRQAFIVRKKRLGQHWITDGLFERTELSTIETTELADGPLPLKDDAWNRLRLVLKGGIVEIVLNDKRVYRGAIEPANQRTFGLFHWADQTEARVRNIEWEGDWPKRLPPVEEQELAGGGAQFLDAGISKLTDSFEHDFARDGLSNRLIQVVGAAKTTVLPGQGVRLTVTSQEEYAEGWLTPRIQRHGDFDVTARFDDITTSGPKDSTLGLFLMHITDDPQLTHSGIYRGHLCRPGNSGRQVTLVEFSRRRSGNRYLTSPVILAEECLSGALRLARRGNMIHCLLSEGDSLTYRHIHTEEIAMDSTIVGGLRLMNSTYTTLEGECKSAVTWQYLSIKARQITYAQYGSSLELNSRLLVLCETAASFPLGNRRSN